MKRSLGAFGLFWSAVFAAGCPLYSDNVVPVDCFYATDCAFGYRCSGGICVQSPPHGGPGGDGGVSEAGSDASRDSVAEGGLADAPALDAPASDASVDAPPSGDAAPGVFCGNPNDCAATETCSVDGTCRAGNCTTIPCINQYQCSVTPFGPACVRGNADGCSADRHCLVSERCIDGTCTAITELCTDRAQCGAGKVCAEGRCTSACVGDAQCAPGYLCRTALGICGAKAEPCLQTRDCGSKEEVCVDGACVPRCGAVGACGSAGGVCVDNGCVPSARLAAQCDGQGTSTGCAAGSICLHRHCYVSCAEDAGGCSASSSAPVCKTVSVAGASYAVCGAADTLGSECDLTAGKLCTDGKICVDGYCR
jgi:hypothetical protein